MGIFDRFKRKPQVIDLERQRRADLLEKGRIVDGTVLDSEETEHGEIIYYAYSIHGVDFESSEILSMERLMGDPLRYAPGAKISVRFDPKNHGNSMLI